MKKVIETCRQIAQKCDNPELATMIIDAVEDGSDKRKITHLADYAVNYAVGSQDNSYALSAIVALADTIYDMGNTEYIAQAAEKLGIEPCPVTYTDLTSERVWEMYKPSTFSMRSISNFIDKYKKGLAIDPFAGNSDKADYTNDIDCGTSAMFHLHATDFMILMKKDNPETILLDPPHGLRWKPQWQTVVNTIKELFPDIVVLSFGPMSHTRPKKGVIDMLRVGHKHTRIPLAFTYCVYGNTDMLI